MDGDRVVAEVSPKIPLVIDGAAGARPLTNDEWVAAENKKAHPCACGCGGDVKVLSRHRSMGIPRHVHGHHMMSMTVLVEGLNAEGLVTVSQAAREIGVGETTLRRAEERGLIATGRKSWGAREPMRVYVKADLPGLKAKMKAGGFRFADDEDLMTTEKMAKAVGVCARTLRHMEERGVIAKAPRDASGRRRMWRRDDVPAVKRCIKNK